MHIHIKKENESIKDIAEGYGVWEEHLRQMNNLFGSEPAMGEELLLLTPTRSYTVQHGDSIEKIAVRFGVGKRDLLSQNPWISTEGVNVGDRLALKYSEPVGGMAVANGYFYKDCSKKALLRALPFLTYVTFGSAIAEKNRIYRTFDDKKEVELIGEEKKIPLVRIYDRYTERYKSGEDQTPFAEGLIELAKMGGYKGIVIDACALNNYAEEFSAFLIVLRKLMIGCDLILITEINENSPIEFSEYADGSIMYYPKYAYDNPPSFDNGERKVLSDFACRGESAKTFVDLPSLATHKGQHITYDEAMKKARKGNQSIIHNESTLLSAFGDRKQGECVFSSLKNIKSLLDAVREFDYMGVCFDIMRTPLAHLMMYNSMFKTYIFNSVRTREGCSRAVEE